MRGFLVVGTLLLVLVWRLDNAVRTAYSSGWTGRTIDLKGCEACRLPGDRWAFVHGGAGVLAVGLFAWLLRLWRGRTVEDPPPTLVWLLRGAAIAAIAAEGFAW